MWSHRYIIISVFDLFFEMNVNGQEMNLRTVAYGFSSSSSWSDSKDDLAKRLIF